MREAGMGGAEEQFTVFRETLIRRYGEAVFKSWFSDLLLDQVDDGTVTLSTESDFRKDRLDQQYKPGMLAAWNEHVYPIRKLLIIKRRDLRAKAARVGGLAPKEGGLVAASKSAFANTSGVNGGGVNGARAQKTETRPVRIAPALEDLASPLDPRMTFESFAVDETNAIAFAAAQRVLSGHGPKEVLYLYGPSGVGKSHVVQACGHAWLKRNPDARCVYIAHNNLTNGCVGAVLSNSIMDLHRDILANDLVMIDDIHLLAGKTRTLDEVLNLINAMASAGRQLIIAGEMAPAKLIEAGVHERIADRLSGGFSVPIEPGGEILRREVLKKRHAAAKGEGEISDEAIELIARLFASSMRECIGAFNQVQLVARGQREAFTAEQAMTVLKSRLSDRRRNVTLDDAIAAAADAFGLTVADLKGRAQPQRIVRARHAFVMASRQVLNESFPRIARALGRDHTTAISSMRRAEALYERDKKFQAAVASIRAALGSA
ncbi:MAG: DnaA/Hda family protein [Parvularculaceae bacterium]